MEEHSTYKELQAASLAVQLAIEAHDAGRCSAADLASAKTSYNAIRDKIDNALVSAISEASP